MRRLSRGGRRQTAAALCIGTLVWAAAARAENDPRLSAVLQPLIAAHSGDAAVAIQQLPSGAAFVYHADDPFPTASLIKLPIMVAAYRLADQGRLDLEQKVVLTDEDKAPGSGVLTDHFSAGTALSVRDYIRLMIAYSDNTATNTVIDRIGLATTAETMAALGLANTKLHSQVYRRDTSIFPERSRQFGLGSTTAGEMIRLLEMLHAGQLASEESTRAMLDHLLACDDRTKLARHLPAEVKIAHKTGAVSKSRCDAGILYTGDGPVAVCVLTTNNADQSGSDDNAGNRLCAEIGRAVATRFGGVSTASDLRAGSAGPLVESLQRTLNARLQPSPGLAVDGDFGANTQAAVERFQREHELDVRGVVDAATWRALGALIESDAPVAPPDVVNSEVLPTQPQPPLDGPPSVTCRAWAIGDASTGEVLYASASTERLQPASTTKIMTALVVLRWAASRPEVMDDTVTFSARADDTVGSTSSLRAGEQVSVRELLYGLLLPSGNDAAVALAEHFGPRVGPPASDDAAANATPADEQFVAAMNQLASELGMPNTHYVNPHGLPDERHVTSAADLLRLAWQAMQAEQFRRVVGARQFGCTVRSTQGYQRNVVWKNTNELLETEGYAGVKTGTTRAAGACLVACGQRDARELLVVVLGSSSSPARYADARNLFRWAWRQAVEH